MTEEPLPRVTIIGLHHPSNQQNISAISIDTDSEEERKDETGL
tara:strand:+ start:3467 stop:3595 length:129 start_codon:yes stop_codon:yes gene_type:complete